MSSNLKINKETWVLIQIFLILAGAPLFLFMDSPWLTAHVLHGQDICNVIAFISYCVILLNSKDRLYWLMLVMTIASLCAEIIGSIILKLYAYRLHNIPVYIPMGHAVIYATVYLISKQPLIRQYYSAIEQSLKKLAFLVCVMSLLILNDVMGFIGYVVFLVIIFSRKKSMFYLIMFFMVYYVELLGTVFSTWAYYGVIGNHPNYPPIGYTPSCIASAYILIDLVSNSTYYYAIKSIKKFKAFFFLNPELLAQSRAGVY